MNLEMQVRNQGNWVPRSISYLCREWDRIHKGDDYTTAPNAYHIGFLDFTLFEDHPEFYATYRLRNINDGYTYSNKFTLSVVELNHINKATDEDRKYGIDKWARLFKVTTWERLAELEAETAKQAATITDQATTITDQAATISDQAATIEQLQNELAVLKIPNK